MPSSFDVSYTYDAVGNRISQTSSAGTIIYTYDAANQLTLETHPGHLVTYTYDADGNVTEKVDDGLSTVYEWDEDNRLISAEPPAASDPTTITYNADGQRVEKTTGAETTKFIYDFKKLLAETDGSDNVDLEYTYTMEEYGDTLSETSSSDTLYHQYDAPGSTSALIYDSDSAVSEYAYRAFGLATDEPAGQPTNMMFIGQQQYYKDTEFELYLLGSGNSAGGGRYYDPSTGRFLSEDPAGVDTDPLKNLYRYVANNPLNATDPSGRDRIDVDEETGDIWWVAQKLEEPSTPESQPQLIPTELDGPAYIDAGKAWIGQIDYEHGGLARIDVDNVHGVWVLSEIRRVARTSRIYEHFSSRTQRLVIAALLAPLFSPGAEPVLEESPAGGPLGLAQMGDGIASIGVSLLEELNLDLREVSLEQVDSLISLGLAKAYHVSTTGPLRTRPLGEFIREVPRAGSRNEAWKAKVVLVGNPNGAYMLLFRNESDPGSALNDAATERYHDFETFGVSAEAATGEIKLYTSPAFELSVLTDYILPLQDRQRALSKMRRDLAIGLLPFGASYLELRNNGLTWESGLRAAGYAAVDVATILVPVARAGVLRRVISPATFRTIAATAIATETAVGLGFTTAAVTRILSTGETTDQDVVDLILAILMLGGATLNTKIANDTLREINKANARIGPVPRSVGGAANSGPTGAADNAVARGTSRSDFIEVVTIHDNMATRQGSFEILIRSTDSILNTEISAAQAMTHRGYDVVLRTPVGRRVGGETSDLLLNGVRGDIYAPITDNVSRVLGAILRKNSQLPSGGIIVLDLRFTTLTANDLANAGARVRGAADKAGVTLNIRRIEIIE